MDDSEKFVVGALQLPINPNREQQRATLEAGIAAAGRQGIALLVLPELHNLPYFCQTVDPALFKLAEPIPGPTSHWLAAQAQQHHLVLIGSIFERAIAGLYYNTAVVLNPDGTLAGQYRKVYIPNDPGYYEKYYFSPGDGGFNSITSSVGTLGVLICWDQWFPEAARSMALQDCELLIYPSAIGWDRRDPLIRQQQELEAWITIQRGHAIANGIPVVCCNRTGLEPDPSGQTAGIDFWGHSFICGVQGELLAQADKDNPGLISACLYRNWRSSIRQRWPFLRDHRHTHIA